MKRFLVLAAAVFLGGCATIIEGTSRNVAVSTPGVEGASCTANSRGISYHVVTPGTIRVGKSMNDVRVVCEKTGYQDGTATLVPSFEPWTVVSLLFGLIGIGVDVVSGAWMDYPDSISIPMQRKTAAAAPYRSPMPAAAPALQPVAMAEYGVRFGAYQSPDGAQRGWQEIWKQYWQQLSGMEPQMVTSQTSGGAPQYHLYGRGLTRERAESLCFYLQQSGQPCEAVRF
ncbi:MAG: SPOR domain-containing protein [Alphaproteobacteria bacterium]|nr:SPOR domain-containing protein [Alphaproteobacteria bacterium]